MYIILYMHVQYIIDSQYLHSYSLTNIFYETGLRKRRKYGDMAAQHEFCRFLNLTDTLFFASSFRVSHMTHFFRLFPFICLCYSVLRLGMLLDHQIDWEKLGFR